MTQQPETPEGWHAFWPCFVRKHGDKTAVLDHSSASGWWCRIHEHEQLEEENGFLPLPAAVAWANDQLGVPKPVEVQERKFADGSYVFKDKENTRWATVSKVLGRWYVGTTDQGRGFDTEDEACQKAREYVRGAQ